MKRLLALVLCLTMLASAALADVIYAEPGATPIANEVVAVRILHPRMANTAVPRTSRPRSRRRSWASRLNG